MKRETLSRGGTRIFPVIVSFISSSLASATTSYISVWIWRGEHNIYIFIYSYRPRPLVHFPHRQAIEYIPIFKGMHRLVCQSALIVCRPGKLLGLSKVLHGDYYKFCFLQMYVYNYDGYKHSLDLLVVIYILHCKNKSLITLVSCEIW